MGCFEYDPEDIQFAKSVCPDCTSDVNEHGGSIWVCGYSTLVCDTCGYSPCEDAC